MQMYLQYLTLWLGGALKYSDETRVPRGVCVSVRDLIPLVIAVVKSSTPTCCLFHCGLSRRFLCSHCIEFRGPRIAVSHSCSNASELCTVEPPYPRFTAARKY